MSPIKRLIHWGPLASMAITASITIATLSTHVALIWVFLFQLTMCLTLYNMWCATLIGPGYISQISLQEEQQEQREQQVPTESGKFCRRCCHIVLKKHHHCPWINNCVGEYNEQYFIRFLLFAIAVTIQSATHLIIHTCQQRSILLFDIFNIALSIGVLISVSVLLYTH